MPIDEAAVYDCADEWFPPFLAVAQMSPSHPLRETALKAAEESVYNSYVDLADSNLPDPDFEEQQDALREVAEDVVKVLRGVADWVAANVELGGRS